MFDYFRALPELANPLPPIRATWSFFPDDKTMFCAYDRKISTNDDNYDYNSNDGDFDDNDDKNDQKTYKYHDFWVKMYQF